MSWRALDLIEDEAGVLLGKEALGDDHVELAGEDGQRNGRRQGERLVVEHPDEAAIVAALHGIEGVLADLVERPRFRSPVGACRKRAHITGVSVSETKADMTTATVTVTANSRNSTPTMPPISSSGMNTAISENGDRDDGEADLARALERRFERRLALLDVAHDVLDHDDGIVDHEADGDGESPSAVRLLTL